MVRKKDLIRLCEKHNDCVFLCFTNGTLIDEAFADDMLRVGNFIPAISLEGFESATDLRRGSGVYKKATDAMALLKRKKLIYGISACYTSANFESITSEEFFDSLIEMGAYFIWYFHYMPVGNDTSPESADHLCAKCDRYAKEWTPVADELWEKEKIIRAKKA